ncbi:MAG: DNA endonuclease SmrA [Halomonadaceae bacterium]|nr:MAG: DNA endonuclease SmrA [Halomonadaceae bacterium]
MTSKDERLQFLQEMDGVKPIRRRNRAKVESPARLTPGQLERQRAAVLEATRDRNPLTADHVEWLGPGDELVFKRSGIQHGVFKKLRMGHYDIEARLDLHRKTVEEARQEVFNFVREGVRFGARNVLILHGKGERNPDRIAVIKSYLAKWLKELPDVMAFHSAQTHHGGTGAVYVMFRKNQQDKDSNRERHGSH